MNWDNELAAVIDHTILDPSRPRRDIERGCEEALVYGFAALVVHPYYVPMVAEKLRGGSVRVCSVVSFPFGADDPDAKTREAERLLAAGAEELDMVMNLSAFLSGDDAPVRREISEVASQCKGRAILKVIIETACLDKAQIARAAVLGAEEGADFIKTSTGYAGGGATPEVVRIIRSALGGDGGRTAAGQFGDTSRTGGGGLVAGSAGVKASGGIRTREFALSLIDAGATRLGCSASLDVIRLERG